MWVLEHHIGIHMNDAIGNNKSKTCGLIKVRLAVLRIGEKMTVGNRNVSLNPACDILRLTSMR